VSHNRTWILLQVQLRLAILVTGCDFSIVFYFALGCAIPHIIRVSISSKSLMRQDLMVSYTTFPFDAVQFSHHQSTSPTPLLSLHFLLLSLLNSSFPFPSPHPSFLRILKFIPSSINHDSQTSLTGHHSPLLSPPHQPIGNHKGRHNKPKLASTPPSCVEYCVVCSTCEWLLAVCREGVDCDCFLLWYSFARVSVWDKSKGGKLRYLDGPRKILGYWKGLVET
jgi:hypothetical protein